MTEIPWPTPYMLEKAGFIKCVADPECKVYVDPINVPSKLCKQHQRSVGSRRRATKRTLERTG